MSRVARQQPSGDDDDDDDDDDDNNDNTMAMMAMRRPGTFSLVSSSAAERAFEPCTVCLPALQR